MISVERVSVCQCMHGQCLVVTSLVYEVSLPTSQSCRCVYILVHVRV
jgi:hypothetical protein